MDDFDVRGLYLNTVEVRLLPAPHLQTSFYMATLLGGFVAAASLS